MNLLKDGKGDLSHQKLQAPNFHLQLLFLISFELFRILDPVPSPDLLFEFSDFFSRKRLPTAYLPAGRAGRPYGLLKFNNQASN